MAVVDKDLKALAYRKIKERIIECEYAPGTIINGIQICEELGISRTPVREAISRLESEGFIKVMPKRGIYVNGISLNDVMQIFQVRLEIEPFALRLAAPRLPKNELLKFRERIVKNDTEVHDGFRLDAAFHLFFVEYCGNRFIIDMMRQVLAQNNRVTISTHQNEAVLNEQLQKEHLSIIDLVLENRIEDAAAAMEAHIRSCRQLTLDHFYMSQAGYVPPEELSYKDMLRNL